MINIIINLFKDFLKSSCADDGRRHLGRSRVRLACEMGSANFLLVTGRITQIRKPISMCGSLEEAYVQSGQTFL